MSCPSIFALLSFRSKSVNPPQYQKLAAISSLFFPASARTHVHRTIFICACVCVCVRDMRKRGREREREGGGRDRGWERGRERGEKWIYRETYSSRQIREPTPQVYCALKHCLYRKIRRRPAPPSETCVKNALEETRALLEIARRKKKKGETGS
jgi:hypothetical protein